MVLKTQVKSLSVFHLLFVIKIACQLYVYLIKTLPTHLNCGAVARHTGTLVVKGNDVYCIHFPAVKVSPCARSGVCGALMSVAILPHCYGQVGVCFSTHDPSDWAQVVLTLCEAIYIFRNTGTWGQKGLLRLNSRQTAKCKTKRSHTCFELFGCAHSSITSRVIQSRYSESEQLSAG